MSRRIRRRLALLLALTLVMGLGAIGWASVPRPQGYGECSRCSCPGYQGSAYTCQRGGCGHHYDDHY